MQPVCVCVRACVRGWVGGWVWVCNSMHVHMCPQARVCVCPCPVINLVFYAQSTITVISGQKHTETNARTHAETHTHTHTHTHARTHAHSLTHSLTRTHARTHARTHRSQIKPRQCDCRFVHCYNLSLRLIFF